MLSEWMNIEILEMNVKEDHIHMILSMPLRLSISKLFCFLRCGVGKDRGHNYLGWSVIVDSQGNTIAGSGTTECYCQGRNKFGRNL